MTPSITVVIPAFKAAAFIDRALQSVFRQTTRPAEIIVVDDGSPDETARIVESYAAQGVKLVKHHRQQGVAQARNTGVEHARGDFIAFLDADDEWLPTKLEKQLARIAADPSLVLVACRADLISATGRNTGDIYHGARPPEGAGAWRTLLARPCIATPSVLVRRSTMREVGAFNTLLNVGEDQDLWIRLALAGPVGFVDAPLVRVHATPGSLSTARFERQAALVLPMIICHVEMQRHRLSPQERRQILGERYARVGQNAICNGEWGFGLKTMAVSVACFRHRPIHNVLFPARVVASRFVRNAARLVRSRVTQPRAPGLHGGDAADRAPLLSARPTSA